MKITSRGLAGKFLAAIGVLVVLAEIALHFVSWYVGTTYEMNHGILLTGAAVGFVGFYMLDPKGAEGGAGFLVRSADTLLKNLPRFGRRSTDAVAIPEAETTVTAKPVTPPDPRNLVRLEHTSAANIRDIERRERGEEEG